MNSAWDHVPPVSTAENYGKSCSCSAKADLCNLTDCRQPWAMEYKRSLRPTLVERIVGIFAALAWWRWRE